ANLFSGRLSTNLFNLTALLFYSGVMVLFDPMLTAVGIALAGCNFLVLRLTARRRSTLSHHYLNEHGKMVSASVGAIRAIETLKANGTEDEAFRRFAGFQANTQIAHLRLGLLNLSATTIATFTTALTTVVILGLGGIKVLEGGMTIGMLVAFQSLMASFSGPVQELAALGSDLQIIRGDLARLADLFRYPVPPAPPPLSEQDVKRLRGQLVMEDITFGYHPLDDPLIEGFSLRLDPGRRLALVGRSGSGKSTLGRLICGLHAPWSGSITLDGRAINVIPPELFAEGVAYVDQEVVLFAGTVRDNLTLWDATIPEQRIVGALEDAMILDEIMGRTGRYDSTVTEGGDNFSGGQRQRLEIARALVNDPALLVLDEATAALDPITEQAIDERLRRRGCGCVIISHRLSAIRDCDEIIVLEKGRVVERGDHTTLMALNGTYTALVGEIVELA
ncbi:MAG: ATP-binding cassette domain-containing protein, partial [Magnetococcales bacterium]|nr:ATP-binding cassette domain-containing protein [Magnetococcales bacterium]